MKCIQWFQLVTSKLQLFKAYISSDSLISMPLKKNPDSKNGGHAPVGLALIVP